MRNCLELLTIKNGGGTGGVCSFLESGMGEANRLTVYLDIIWLLNFLFDSLLLLLTAIILKRSCSIWRLLGGGLIGSMIILLSVTPFHAYSSHTLVKLLFSIVMVLMTFGYKRLRYFLASLTTLYFVTFLMGGSIIGVHYFLNFDMQLSSSVLLASVKGFGDPISWLFVLLGFPVAWHFSRLRIGSFEMKKIQFDQLVDVAIYIQDRRYDFVGLVDSGNQLYDPLGKLPVMLVSLHKSDEKIPEALLNLAKSEHIIMQGKLDFPKEFEDRIRIIPCRVVGQEHQLIVAIKPEKVILTLKGESHVVDKSLVSFTLQQLSVDDVFQCVVHPKMLLESNGHRITNETKASFV